MAEEAPFYDELRIGFHPTGPGHYRTVTRAEDESTGFAAFEDPFAEFELDNFVLRFGRQRLPLRAYRSTQMEQAREFGTRLFEALMAGEVRDVYRAARGAARTSNRGLRLTLSFTETPELMNLPWEFLFDKPRFLSQSVDSPVVRSLDLREAPLPHPLSLPLNVLGMISSPSGYAPLDVEREREKLAAAFGPLQEQGLATLEWLERGNPCAARRGPPLESRDPRLPFRRPWWL